MPDGKAQALLHVLGMRNVCVGVPVRVCACMRLYGPQYHTYAIPRTCDSDALAPCSRVSACLFTHTHTHTHAHTHTGRNSKLPTIVAKKEVKSYMKQPVVKGARDEVRV